MGCADLRIEDAVNETMCFAAVHESGFWHEPCRSGMSATWPLLGVMRTLSRQRPN
jgi:hypothetical protein